jgi:hypothetical protein
VFDDGTERERRQICQAAADDDDAEKEADEQRAVSRQSAARLGDVGLGNDSRVVTAAKGAKVCGTPCANRNNEATIEIGNRM